MIRAGNIVRVEWQLLFSLDAFAVMLGLDQSWSRVMGKKVLVKMQG